VPTGPLELALLVLAALAAGAVDAVAGGGGLLTVPALAAAGLPPHLVLGTNKGQSVFGSCSALVAYARAGLVDRDRARLTFPLAFLGSLAGAALVLAIRPEVLRPLVLALLVLAALAVGLRRAPPSAAARLPERLRLPAAGARAPPGRLRRLLRPGHGTFLILGSSASSASRPRAPRRRPRS
jgi:uncharacterized membrane protein YfcA